MTLQVLDALGIDKAYALGTSQGGWIVARMAILAPERVCNRTVIHMESKTMEDSDRISRRYKAFFSLERLWTMNPVTQEARVAGTQRAF